MIRVLLATVCLVLTVATAHASALDDLKAANTAAQHGKIDEAVRLFSQALAASDLSAADRVTAYKGRASEYIGKSLIDDAFQRLDQARQARKNAIADFTAALKLKTDDAALYVARAQAYAFNGENDSAIADFDAALKLDNSPLTLLQRGASLLAKGDYDRAIADYTAAIALAAKPAKDANDAGPDAADLYSERGKAQFIAAHYADAAADLDKALTLGSAARSGDVLWLPYQIAWLHVARARAGQNDTEELKLNAGKIDLKQWPGTLVAYFLGQAKIDQLTPPSGHGAMGHSRECNLSFFAGEQALAKNESAQAARLFTRARAACNIHTVQYIAAEVESKRLGK
jgi:tetratricopeptide (TPR) repeat protein